MEKNPIHKDEYKIIYYEFLNNYSFKDLKEEFYIKSFINDAFLIKNSYTYSRKDFFNNYLHSYFHRIKNDLFKEEDFFKFLSMNSGWLKSKNEINHSLTTQLTHNYQEIVDEVYNIVRFHFFTSNVEFYNFYNPFPKEEDFNHFLAETVLYQLVFDPYNKQFDLKKGTDSILKEYLKKVIYNLRINHDKIDKKQLALEINRLKAKKIKYNLSSFQEAIKDYTELLNDLKEISNKAQILTGQASIKLNLNKELSHRTIESDLFTLYDQNKELKKSLRKFIYNSFNTHNKNQEFRNKDFLQAQGELPIRDHIIFIEFFWILYKENGITDSFSRVSLFLEQNFPFLGNKNSIEQIPSKHNFKKNYSTPNMRTFLENRRTPYNKKQPTTT